MNETQARQRWEKVGLSGVVRDDLVALATELANVTGKTIAQAISQVDDAALSYMEGRLLSRVRDTIHFNGDLDRKP